MSVEPGRAPESTCPDGEDAPARAEVAAHGREAQRVGLARTGRRTRAARAAGVAGKVGASRPRAKATPARRPRRTRPRRATRGSRRRRRPRARARESRGGGRASGPTRAREAVATRRAMSDERTFTTAELKKATHVRFAEARLVRFQDVDAAGIIFYPRVLEHERRASRCSSRSGWDLPKELGQSSVGTPSSTRRRTTSRRCASATTCSGDRGRAAGRDVVHRGLPGAAIRN